MDIWILISFLCIIGLDILLVSGQGKVGEGELTFQPPGTLKQGQTLTITCTVFGKARFDFMRIMRVTKEEKYSIAMTRNLEAAYLESGRYKLEYEDGGPDGKSYMKLEISDIQGKDAGRIACLHVSGDKVVFEVFEDIKVDVKPEKVDLLYQAVTGEIVKSTDDSPLMMTQNVESAIICNISVDGSTKAPEIKVSLDGKDVKGVFKNNVKKDDGSTFEGFLVKTYWNKMEYRSITPNYDWNGKTLKCSATMPGFEPVVAESKVEIQYGPQFDCEKVYYVKPDTEDVQLKCSAKMHPPPTISEWSFGSDINQTKIRSGEEDDEGFYRAVKNDLGGDNYEFKLFVKKATIDKMVNYRLEITNDVAVNQHFIKLHEEGSHYEPVGSSTTVHLPKSVFLILVAIQSTLIATRWL